MTSVACMARIYSVVAGRSRKCWWRTSNWRQSVTVSSSKPIWIAMIKTQRSLGFLIGRHLMLVLTTHLGESTHSFMDPLVAIYLLLATRRRDNSLRGGICDNSINSQLKSSQQHGITMRSTRRRDWERQSSTECLALT